MGEVLGRLARRMERYLPWRGLLRTFEDEVEAGREGDPILPYDDEVKHLLGVIAPWGRPPS